MGCGFARLYMLGGYLYFCAWFCCVWRIFFIFVRFNVIFIVSLGVSDGTIVMYLLSVFVFFRVVGRCALTVG